MDNTETANIRLLQNVKEIMDFDASELDVYARLTEAQLLNKDHPENIFLFFVIYRILLLSYYTE